MSSLIERLKKDRRPMKVLLTGGAGYIGTHTIAELYAAGHTAVVVDNFSNSSKKAIKAINKIIGTKVPFHEADCRDYDNLGSIFRSERPDAVIHLAGLKSVNESVGQPLLYWQNNIDSTLTLLKVMGEVGCKTLIFSSSATVYGTPKALPITEEAPIGIGLSNPYGETKYTIERILNSLHDSDPTWNITVLRYFNPVGAHSSGLIGEDPKGIPNNLMPYIAQVATGKLPRLNIYGSNYSTPDGTGVRDYIHVTDLANGHVAALKSKSKSGFRAYNLGTGQGTSVLELLHAYEDGADKNIPYRIVAPRQGDVASAYADPSKANRELNWSTRYSVSDACKSSYHWQTKNPNGFAITNNSDIYARYVKRAIDILACIIAISLLSIPMLIIAISIKLSSKGPAIFKQTRIGRNNRHFTIYKFRSMRTDAPHDVSPYQFRNADQYITKVGKFLRKTSLDELPQLFNILKGDMSLVGPRPAGINDKHRIRLRKKLGIQTLRPGLTGWAQVNGRDLISETKKAELDAEYLSNTSFLQDLKCLFKTSIIVLTRYGNIEGSEISRQGSSYSRRARHEN